MKHKIQYKGKKKIKNHPIIKIIAKINQNKMVFWRI